VPWTRARIALVASAAVSALAMLYVGFFQIGWLSRLACPGFGSGCESVALAPFSFPLGLANGLLFAALAGLLCAAAQAPGREAAAGLVVLSFVNVIATLVHLLQMQKLGAFSTWGALAAVLSVPIAVLAAVCARPASGGGDPAGPVPPDDHPEQRQ
jgi:hypothetical protein